MTPNKCYSIPLPSLTAHFSVWSLPCACLITQMFVPVKDFYFDRNGSESVYCKLSLRMLGHTESHAAVPNRMLPGVGGSWPGQIWKWEVKFCPTTALQLFNLPQECMASAYFHGRRWKGAFRSISQTGASFALGPCGSLPASSLAFSHLHCKLQLILLCPIMSSATWLC